MRTWHPALVIFGLACACHGEGSAFTTSTSTTSTSTSTGGSGGAGSSGEASSTSSGGSTVTSTTADVSTGGPTTEAGTAATSASTFDVGSDKDVGGGAPPGCKGKIDFLFVISRAPLMNEVQTNLIDAFPKFIATIQSKFEDFDYHIMVVDTDKEWGLYYCTDDCPALACKIGEDCCPVQYPPWNGQPCCPAPDYPCGSLDLVGPCDESIGAGNVFAAGYHAANKPCKIDGDRRYLIKGQSDLAETFSCIAQVGTSGWDKSGDALTAAMTYTINNPGGCNEGFLRKDALLMVTMVNPGGDTDSQGGPEHWYNAVVVAKSFDPASVVMLNIGNDLCPDYDEICELTKMFPYHWIADNDEVDYGPIFDKAASLVEDACSVFVPQ